MSSRDGGHPLKRGLVKEGHPKVLGGSQDAASSASDLSS